MTFSRQSAFLWFWRSAVRNVEIGVDHPLVVRHLTRGEGGEPDGQVVQKTNWRRPCFFLPRRKSWSTQDVYKIPLPHLGVAYTPVRDHAWWGSNYLCSGAGFLRQDCSELSSNDLHWNNRFQLKIILLNDVFSTIFAVGASRFGCSYLGRTSQSTLECYSRSQIESGEWLCDDRYFCTIIPLNLFHHLYLCLRDGQKAG